MMTDDAPVLLKRALEDLNQAALELSSARRSALAALDALAEERRGDDRNIRREFIAAFGEVTLAALESCHTFSSQLGRRG